ncbi:MAG: hypothetical protein ABIU54_06400 [Candidatus Eisenbacteria bacterium]
MPPPIIEWLSRSRRTVIALFVLLLAIIIAQSFFLYQQRVVDKARRLQSDKLLTTFLQGDTAQSAGGSSVAIRLQNVRFKWSDKVYIDAGNMAVRAVPAQGRSVDFDNLESFHLVVQQSVVRIRPDVLGGMFNESIFNYPESRVRDLDVSITKDVHGVPMVVLAGKVNVLAWLPFTMYTHLSLDVKTNTLVITVDHLKLLGIIPATKLIHWTPLHLDRLIALPPNKSLWVDGNQIMVKPFGLFPPPRINGRIGSITVGASEISIGFAGDPITAPKSSARNYVYMRGGTSQFGRFRMVDTDILILDKEPKDPFVFSLRYYAQMLPRSIITLPDAQSAQLTMPDFKGPSR